MKKTPNPAAPLVLIGGSFDPVHRGHLAMAAALAQALPTARICFLPTAASPFKTRQSAARHRLAMLRLALRDTPYGIETHEIHQQRTCYTIDTLSAIRARIGPVRPLIFALGRDAFDSLPRWKGEYGLLQVAHLWVFARPACPTAPLPSGLLQQVAATPTALCAQPAGLIWLDASGLPDVSSSAIREHPATSRPLLPPRVYGYTVRSTLYGKKHPHD